MKALLIGIAAAIISFAVAIILPLSIVLPITYFSNESAINKKGKYYILKTLNQDRKIIFKGKLIKEFSNLWWIHYFKLNNNGWVIYVWSPQYGLIVLDKEGNIKTTEGYFSRNTKQILRYLAYYDKEFDKIYNKKYKTYVYLCGPPNERITK